jgi:hypothetical protein
MGRTIDICYTHRERPGGSGKGPLTLCTPIGTDQGVMGKTYIHVWEGPLILFTPIGKDQEDQVGWKRPAYIYGKDH